MQVLMLPKVFLYNNPMTTKKRYEELKQEVNFHNHRYHVLDAPVISDAEYDRLLVELRAIEAEHPDWVTPDSPSQRAGASPSDKFEKVRHPRPSSAWPMPSARTIPVPGLNASAGSTTVWKEQVSLLSRRLTV